MELILLRSLARLFRTPNAVMVDVGAQAGLTAGPFARNRWRVFCFEPEPSNREILQKELGTLPNVRISPAAVCDKVGTEDFYVSDVHWGIHGLTPFHTSHRTHFRVPTTTLATFLTEAAVERLDLLKIDVEGAEMSVIRGLDWARWHPDFVVMEFFSARSRQWYGYSAADLVKFMRQEGYEPWVLEYGPIDSYDVRGRSTPHRLSRVYPLRSGEPTDDVCGNLYFVSPRFQAHFGFLLRTLWFLAKTKRAITGFVAGGRSRT